MVACVPAIRTGLDRALDGQLGDTALRPRRAEPAHAAAAVTAAVERSRRALVLDAADVGGDAERAVEEAASTGGYATLARHWQTSPVIETTGSFAEYTRAHAAPVDEAPRALPPQDGP